MCVCAVLHLGPTWGEQSANSFHLSSVQIAQHHSQNKAAKPVSPSLDPWAPKLIAYSEIMPRTQSHDLFLNQVPHFPSPASPGLREAHFSKSNPRTKGVSLLHLCDSPKSQSITYCHGKANFCGDSCKQRAGCGNEYLDAERVKGCLWHSAARRPD